MVKRLPSVQETQVQFLGQEDPLEKEMATHSSTLAWVTKSDMTERLHFHFPLCALNEWCLSLCNCFLHEKKSAGCSLV